MDRVAKHPLMQEAKTQVQRLEENIAFQQQMIAKLDEGGHDVRAARMFLRRLMAQHAKLVAERDRLSKELPNRV